MTDSIMEFRAALYERLNTDVALSAVVTGVFDAADDDQAYPFVELGDDNSSEADTKSTTGYHIEIRLHIYSQSKSRMEASEICALVRAALNVPLVITDNKTVTQQITHQSVFTDRDPNIRHGVLTLKSTIEKL